MLLFDTVLTHCTVVVYDGCTDVLVIYTVGRYFAFYSSVIVLLARRRSRCEERRTHMSPDHLYQLKEDATLITFYLWFSTV